MKIETITKSLFIILSIMFSNALLAQETGTASYYANKFEGRKTASGEIFHQDSLTAAHKTLPMGTYVSVTNLANDSTVVVKINDRLPKSSKRTIDLSRSAAEQLDFIRKGLTQVVIVEIKPDENELLEKKDTLISP